MPTLTVEMALFKLNDKTDHENFTSAYWKRRMRCSTEHLFREHPRAPPSRLAINLETLRPAQVVTEVPRFPPSTKANGIKSWLRPSASKLVSARLFADTSRSCGAKERPRHVIDSAAACLSKTQRRTGKQRGGLRRAGSPACSSAPVRPSSLFCQLN